MKVPKKYEDCRMLESEAGVPKKCAGLKRLYCRDEGRCAFYKSTSEPGPKNRYRIKKKEAANEKAGERGAGGIHTVV